jgi:hypothetical protein
MGVPPLKKATFALEKSLSHINTIFENMRQRLRAEGSSAATRPNMTGAPTAHTWQSIVIQPTPGRFDKK